MCVGMGRAIASKPIPEQQQFYKSMLGADLSPAQLHSMNTGAPLPKAPGPALNIEAGPDASDPARGRTPVASDSFGSRPSASGSTRRLVNPNLGIPKSAGPSVGLGIQ